MTPPARGLQSCRFREAAAARPVLVGAAFDHLFVVFGHALVRLVAVGGFLFVGSGLTTGVGVGERLASLLVHGVRVGEGAFSTRHVVISLRPPFASALPMATQSDTSATRRYARRPAVLRIAP